MSRRVALLVTASVTAAVGAVALAALPANAAAGCRVSYAVTSQWPSGFQGGLTVTNLGDPLATWTIGFAFPDPNQKITQGWSGRWSQTA